MDLYHPSIKGREFSVFSSAIIELLGLARVEERSGYDVRLDNDRATSLYSAAGCYQYQTTNTT